MHYCELLGKNSLSSRILGEVYWTKPEKRSWMGLLYWEYYLKENDTEKSCKWTKVGLRKKRMRYAKAKSNCNLLSEIIR